MQVFYFFKQRLYIFLVILSNKNKQRLYKIQKRPTSLFYHVLLIKQNECILGNRRCRTTGWECCYVWTVLHFRFREKNWMHSRKSGQWSPKKWRRLCCTKNQHSRIVSLSDLFQRYKMIFLTAWFDDEKVIEFQVPCTIFNHTINIFNLVSYR